MTVEPFVHNLEEAQDTDGSIYIRCKYCLRINPDTNELCSQHPEYFKCRGCGNPTLCAPDPSKRAVCPECCSEHDYEYDPGRRDQSCKYCDGSPPWDHYLYNEPCWDR